MYMRRAQLYLDEAQQKLLARLSRRTGESLGRLIRETVDQVYCGKKTSERPFADDDPIWRFAGSGKSREGDVAARHDHCLCGRQDEDVR
jgi:hypothetical protein